MKVVWVGFEKEESSWERLKTICERVLQVVKMELREMKLDRVLRSRLQQKYAINL